MQENPNQLSTNIDKKNEINTILSAFGAYDIEFLVSKYYINQYAELPRTYSVYSALNLEHFLKKITEQYSLTDDNFILKDEQSKDKKINEPDYSTSTYLIKIKDKLLIELTSYKVYFLYSKSIPFSEIEAITALIKESKKKKKHKRKFYMITANSRSEYGFEFRKFNIKKPSLLHLSSIIMMILRKPIP